MSDHFANYLRANPAMVPKLKQQLTSVINGYGQNAVEAATSNLLWQLGQATTDAARAEIVARKATEIQEAEARGRAQGARDGSLQAYKLVTGNMQLDGYNPEYYPRDISEVVSFYNALPLVPGSREAASPRDKAEAAHTAAMRYVHRLIEEGPNRSGAVMASIKAELQRENQVALGQAPNTLGAFLQSSGIGRMFFYPPTGVTGQPYQEMHKETSGGDFSLSPNQARSAEMLAQEVLDMAKSKGVDIRRFDDIKKVMGYDTNPNELTVKELAAYMVGMSVEATRSREGVFRASIRPELNIKSEASTLALEAGRQVFGDTTPNQSSTDTSTEASMKAVKDNARGERC